MEDASQRGWVDANQREWVGARTPKLAFETMYHPSLRSEPLWTMYKRFVEAYSRRVLTNDADGLSAFSGLLSRLEELFHTEFTDGLPVNELHWSLLWKTRRSRNSKNLSWRQFKESNENILPSWTWAAWRGAIEFSSHEGFSTNAVIFRATSSVPLNAIYNRKFTAPRCRVDSKYFSNLLPMVVEVASSPLSTGKASRDRKNDYEINNGERDQIGTGSADDMKAIDFPGNGVFLRIAQQSRRDKATRCQALLVKLGDFPLLDSPEAIATKLKEKVTEWMILGELGTEKEINDLLLRHRCSDRKKFTEEDNIFLACRLGVGYIDIVEWDKAEVRKVLVFLG